MLARDLLTGVARSGGGDVGFAYGVAGLGESRFRVGEHLGDLFVGKEGETGHKVREFLVFDPIASLEEQS